MRVIGLDIGTQCSGRKELRLRAITRKQARAFIAQHHSHNRPPSASVFQLGVESGGELVGVAIGGIPNARMLMDGETIEITRVATNGTRNACSMLYAAACRAAKALGYTRALTYTLESEEATALRATGWRADPDIARRNPHDWQNRVGARRQTVDLFGNVNVPTEAKRRWCREL